MNLSITGRHLEITPAIREYASQKVARIGRHFDQIIDIQVTLSVEKLEHIAEVTVRLPGKDIHCEARDENLYASIDLLADKIDRQVVKYKGKVQNHAHDPVKRQEVPAE